MFNVTPVFDANEKSKAKIVINQGGTSSSKTYSIMQLLLKRCCYEKRIVVTITGESIPNLKKGAYRDAENIFQGSAFLQSQVDSWNKAERLIYFNNGSVMEFTSNLDEQSAKNGKRDYLFCNEANGISWLIFFQLAIRTRKQTFIDYNPTAPYWADDNLKGTDPSSNELSATVEMIRSDHRHNTFLTEEEHNKIEGIKDPQLWKVYARGITGNITGIIYPNWIKIPDESFPRNLPIFGGLDFGFTNDPTAGIKICRDKDNIYLHELCYVTGLSAKLTKQYFFNHGFTADTPIYCDHQKEPVAEIRREGLMAILANKSVENGIKKVKEFNVYYTASSENIDWERKRYIWINNPITGKPSNTPIDGFDHLMDAARYGIYTHYFQG